MKDREKSGSAKGGFSIAKLVVMLVGTGIIGTGIWGGKYMLSKDEEKIRNENFWKVKKEDFLVTVKLTGTLVSTDEVMLKSELEGHSTIRYVIEEGTKVEGNFEYTIQSGDTLESIAESNAKDALNIKALNKDLKLDWDHLKPGQEITLPGKLLIELDPLDLKGRINQMDIVVQRSENALARIKGNFRTVQLSAVLALKRAQNDHQIAGSELEKTRNSTVKNYIDDKVGLIANLEEEVALAEKNLKAYTELRELGFVSDVEVLREKAKRNKALHTIKMTRADLDAYKKYDQASLISIKQLTVDEAFVNIEKTKVQTVADLSDANSSISTQEKTLNLEKERLEDLREQMANTRIYAPEPGVVVYYAPRHWEKQELVSNGSNVRRGQNLIKLPKDKSLKVDLSVPQAMRAQLKRGRKAWVQVENGEPLPGTLSMLSKIVDSNRRGHTQKSYFKGEITIDREEFPDSVSEGMTVTVEIQVINLIGENQRIKVPNQCVISQVIDDVAETGCWVLNPDTNELSWRPVTIEYNDKNFVAIKDETDPGRGLREDELVLLAPLTQADNMNLEEGVTNKGKVKLGEPKLDEDAKEKSSTGG